MSTAQSVYPLARQTTCEQLPSSERNIERLAKLAVLSLPSRASQRNYAREIEQFIASRHELNRSGVMEYLQSRRQSGKSASSCNLALAAIRCLAREANAHGLISELELSGMSRIKQIKQTGTRLGRWLDTKQAGLLMNSVSSLARDEGTDENIRNAAIIACLLGGGMRRSEVITLEWSQWREVNGRMAWVDIVGKGGKVRTVPVNGWAAEHIERWKERATEAPNKTSTVFSLSSQSIYLIALEAGRRAGLGDNLAPHHLRRTFARLAYESCGRVEQVQAVLGHSNPQTTAKYIGVWLELRQGRAASDFELD